MDDEMYPGMTEASPSETPDKPAPKEEKDETETALLPMSLFGGADPKPGEEYVFEVVRKYDDEVEVKYSTKPEGEDRHAEANEKLDAMGMEMGGSE